MDEEAIRRKAETEEDEAPLLGYFILALCGVQIATYVMAFTRWFMTDHTVFWRGFKELLWVLCPIANFIYVWDWWMVAIEFVSIDMFEYLVDWFEQALALIEKK